MEKKKEWKGSAKKRKNEQYKEQTLVKKKKERKRSWAGPKARISPTI